MPHADALTAEILKLATAGFFPTLRRFDDDRVAERYPQLSRLARAAGAPPGKLGATIIAIVRSAIDDLGDAVPRVVLPEYLNLDEPARDHKERQAAALARLRALLGQRGTSAQNFRLNLRRAWAEEIASILRRRAGEHPPARAEQDRVPPGMVRAAGPADWPVARRPAADQAMVVLIASPGMRLGPRSPMIKLVRELEPFLRAARPMIYAVGGSHTAIVRNRLLEQDDVLEALPAGFEGGLVYATELVLQAHGHHEAAVVYLQDPGDPASLYPDTVALKRVCIVKKTPFLTSLPAALRWFRLEWAQLAEERPRERRTMGRHLLDRKQAESTAIAGMLAESDRDIALAAQDALKPEMLEFASEFEELLSDGFATRYATQVTGHLLNGGDIEDPVMRDFARLGLDDEEALLSKIAKWQQQHQAASSRLARDGWATLMTHGRHGGVTQLSRKILDGSCATAIFLQDPTAAREHDDEIQVLDRATQLPTADCLLLYDETSARRWAANLVRCLEPDRRMSPTTLIEAYRKVFGVDLVLAHPPPADARTPSGRVRRKEVWSAVAKAAATYFREAMRCANSERAAADPPVRVGVSWGGAIRDVLHRVDDDPFAAAPERLRVVPTVGVLGSADREVESHVHAQTLARRVGGHAVSFPEYAFLKGSGPTDRAQEKVDEWLRRDWRELDLALYGCDIVRENLTKQVVGFPDELHRALLGAEATEYGTIYLDPSDRREVRLADYGAYCPTGVSFPLVQELAAGGGRRSEVIFVAGEESERVRPAWAALRAGLASTFITDVDFAWSVLECELPELVRDGG